MSVSQTEAEPAGFSGVAPTRDERIGVILLSIASFAYAAGDSALLVVVSWILTVAGMADGLGLVLALFATTRLLLMPAGAVLADRVERRLVLVATSSVRTILSVALVAAGPDSMTVSRAGIVMGLAGATSSFHYPADRSIVVDIARTVRLSWANGWVHTCVQTAQVAGPAAGGVLLTRGSAAVALVYVSSQFAIAAVGFCYLKPRVRAISGPRSGRPHTFGPSGMLQRGGALWPLLLVLAAVNFGFVGPFSIAIPALVHEQPHSRATDYALIQVAFGVGAIVGAQIAARFAWSASGPSVVASAVISSGMFAVGALAGGTAWTGAVYALVGLGSGLLNVGLLTLLQVAAAGPSLGRVMGLVTMVTLGLAPVSQALAGTLVSRSSARWTLLAGGTFSAACVLVLAPIVMVAVRRLSNLDGSPGPGVDSPESRPVGEEK